MGLSTLGIEVLALAATMTLACALPLYSPVARKNSMSLFLVGTGAMFGLCFFDLVPDVLELGGRSGLWIMGAVWLAYSAVHLLHLSHHHADDGHGHEHGKGPGFALFLGSLLAHGFASGMLLTVSMGLSDRIAGTVFAALLAHKVYESLLLSSVLLVQKRSAWGRALIIGLYASALPLGAGVMSVFHDSINQEIAAWVSSVAVGTLLGCLIFDFLMPSFRHLRERRFGAGWLLAGLLLTQLIMRLV